MLFELVCKCCGNAFLVERLLRIGGAVCPNCGTKNSLRPQINTAEGDMAGELQFSSGELDEQSKARRDKVMATAQSSTQQGQTDEKKPKKRKKMIVIASIAAAVLMVFGLVLGWLSIGWTYYTYGDFRYGIDNKRWEITIYDYLGDDEQVIIPEKIKGLPVTSIGKYAFNGCSSLTSIEIPDSVTSIGNDAFLYCSSLTSVYITDIAAWCNISFENFFASPVYAAENLYWNNKLVTELVIPDSVTSIGDWAFYNCSSLTSIEIPDSVTSIGEYAFYNCSSLQYTVKDGLRYLGNANNRYMYLAGTETTDITTAKIEDACKFVGSSAFYNCSSLTSVAIGDSVTSIGEYAFHGCGSLTSVVIGDGVTSIGSSAFYACSSLKSVAIGDRVTSIGSSAFSGCSSLTSVVIPDSVTSVGGYAFYNCSSLTSIEIPDSVTSIGDSAFEGCSSLTSIKYRGTEAQWQAIRKGRNWNKSYRDYTITYHYQGE